ncbi:toprim domain-containing protein [Candidatus Uhrbacteria bacterium]|nr:toprim domain-containing protein [Candidatus Uhrbacteria bacterium]
MSTIDDIKAKIDLADFLREQGIQLKPAGSSLKACCPFHNEKSPSFMVNRQKQVYYCFGCSKGGDVFTFVQEREGLEFGEALRLLAERAGVQLEARDPRLEGQKTRSLAVLELAAKWWHHQLTKTPQGEVARAYAAKRGIAAGTVERFALGYASDAWDPLTEFLVSRKFTPQEIVEAGLAIVSRESRVVSREMRSNDSDVNLTPHASRLTPRIYDRFRHRLVFPIHDLHGRIVGCTARILDGGKTVGPAGETPAKYVNTPETALYKKGAILYGLWHARDGIRKAGYAVLVEGQMDVIASHEAGLDMTIATSGTALTEQQLHLLKRFTTTIHVAFDADPAGQGAAERGIDAALDAGFDVRVIRMPNDADGKPIAKDADECIRSNADAWREAVAHPIPVFDFYLDCIRTKYDLRNPAGQRDAGRVLVAHLQHVVDPIERAAWLRRCAEVIGIPEQAMQEAITRTRTRTSVAAERVSPIATLPSGASKTVERLLALVLRYPEHIPAVVAILPNGEALGEPYTALYNTRILRYSGQHGGDPIGDGLVERLQLFADREFGDWEHAAIAREAVVCGRAIRKEGITEERRVIAERLRDLERSVGGARSDAGALADLERRFDDLNRELKMLSSN